MGKEQKWYNSQLAEGIGLAAIILATGFAFRTCYSRAAAFEPTRIESRLELTQETNVEPECIDNKVYRILNNYKGQSNF